MIDKEMCCCSIKNENIKCEYNPQCAFLKELFFLRKSLSESLQSKEHILKKLHKYRCTLKEIKKISEEETTPSYQGWRVDGYKRIIEKIDEVTNGTNP